LSRLRLLIVVFCGHDIVAIMTAAGYAARTRKQAADVLVFCSVHRLWFVLHSQLVYRRHHRQLQHEQTTGFFLDTWTHKCDIRDVN